MSFSCQNRFLHSHIICNKATFSIAISLSKCWCWVLEKPISTDHQGKKILPSVCQCCASHTTVLRPLTLVHVVISASYSNETSNALTKCFCQSLPAEVQKKTNFWTLLKKISIAIINLIVEIEAFSVSSWMAHVFVLWL